MAPPGGRPLFSALAVALRAQVRAQPPQNPYPCVSDCLQEALAANPTKGCGLGEFWLPYPPTDPAGACRPCSLGFYCPGIPYGEFPGERVNLNRRIACPNGTYIDVTGATSLSECIDCERGRYQYWYGRSACIPCPAGKYVNATASTSKYDCVDCPCGHYCPEDSPVPTPCPPGTYTENVRMQVLEACLECPPGTACPEASCDPVGCSECPAGKFGNTSGLSAVADGSAGAVCNLMSDACTPCPPSFFCPKGSIVPTSCPAGTISGEGTPSKEACVDCPVGHRCQLPVNHSTEQSLVYREADGSPKVGAVDPEPCAVDATVAHYSYPDVRGCEEGCPYQLERQSFCHRAGDGRPPDRGRLAVQLGELIALRSAGALTTEAERVAALGNLTEVLGNLTHGEGAAALAMVDRNGRTPLMLAAILGDVEVLPLLWDGGANATAARAVRDGSGFTALMHALQLGHAAAAAWLTSVAGASLSEGDVRTLRQLEVDVAGVPVGDPGRAPEYLGRGALAWAHPSGEAFVDAPWVAAAP